MPARQRQTATTAINVKERQKKENDKETSLPHAASAKDEGDTIMAVDLAIRGLLTTAVVLSGTTSRQR